MVNYVTWYKDEPTYLRFKEICEDKSHFGESYDSWVRIVQKKIDEAEALGQVLTKVAIDPEQFLNWCKINGKPLNGASRGLFCSVTVFGDSPKTH
ncbi:hypothetical protein [Candidatus Methylomicrobium oryzae]|uniref:hypothetical protein n=1 Tax=Candidatus Methylomicrobium oryzae TaxID=2802053 RepID=UPI0019232B6A|nr:hypothetical protein [Methylomicrobium sp. RS1]MBL1264382.1 hypothetical protein [Methylomicrobium sp. RS1]